MIKMYTAFTEEVDDPRQAVKDILSQLKPQERQLKNTIALVYFHYNFAVNDNLKIFAEKMPFEIVGCMSTYMGTNGMYGDVAVTVTMFTSYDVSFDVKTIENINDKPIAQMREEVKEVCGRLCEKENPKLMLSLLPTMPHFCGNDLMNAVNKFDKSLLLFGMHVFNIDGVPDTNLVLAGQKLSSAMIVIISFYGSINPRFTASSSFTFTESFGETVEITDAYMSTIKSVNGKPALDYLKKQGLITPGKAQNTASLIAVPAILTYKNKSKVSCAFIDIDETNGYVIAARTVEKGAKLVLSQLDGEKTLAGAKDTILGIRDDHLNDCLIFSCSARVWSIGSNLFSEMQAIEEGAREYEEKLEVPLNYSIAYSGGEICPIINIKGGYANMVHNYTLVVCAFN